MEGIGVRARLLHSLMPRIRKYFRNLFSYQSMIDSQELTCSKMPLDGLAFPSNVSVLLTVNAPTYYFDHRTNLTNVPISVPLTNTPFIAFNLLRVDLREVHSCAN